MNTRIQTAVQNEKGFTLVELAVVMVIVGLLIGGILKGQEMIANAQVTSAVAQIKSMDAATSTFRDKFNGLPGDLVGAATQLQNCAAAPCVAGNGDGNLGVAVGAAPGGESLAFFPMLLAADLITGMDGALQAAPAFGHELPTASVGGGFTVGYTDGGLVPNGFTAAEMRPGHYIVLMGQAIAVAAATGKLTPVQAATIDRKMDDGLPNQGGVVAQTAAGECRAAGAAVYDESLNNQQCAIAIRIQG